MGDKMGDKMVKNFKKIKQSNEDKDNNDSFSCEDEKGRMVFFPKDEGNRHYREYIKTIGKEKK